MAATGKTSPQAGSAAMPAGDASSLASFQANLPMVDDRLYELPKPQLNVDHRRLRDRVRRQMEAGDLDSATATVEACFQQGQKIDALYFLHEVAMEPLMEHFALAENGIEQAVYAAESTSYWHEAAPENPYSSALLTLSLLQLACEAGGTNWLDPTEDDETFEQCVEHARLVMNTAKADHKNHWFWAMAHLRLMQFEEPTNDERWECFRTAAQAQPHSLALWTQFSLQLMPHQGGRECDLSRLCLQAWRQTKGRSGTLLYHHLLASIQQLAGDACTVSLLPQAAEALVEEFANAKDDHGKTLAICSLAQLGRHEEAVQLMGKTNTLHLANWLIDESPAMVAAMGKIHLSANTLAA